MMAGVGVELLREQPEWRRDPQELLHQARLVIKNTIEQSTKGQNPINMDYVKGAITEDISKFLLQKTAKRPIVIPVLLTI